MTLERVLVTGGAGFIGSALVRRLIRGTDASVLTVDKLTYAGHLSTLEDAFDDPRHRFEQVDVCDGEALRALFAEFRPTSVMHLAAESHVDRSIDSAAEFVRTNVVGTGTILEEARRHWKALPADEAADFRFLHVSTDEVYGSLEDGALFTESSPYEPNSPYAASKAGADHLVRAWSRTHGLPCLVTNCSNNYGPYQFPEKLIPLMVLNAAAGRPLPVYGGGENVRDWLHVEDHVDALLAVLERGRPGETYLIGGRNPVRNIDVVHRICDILDEAMPDAGTGSRRALIEYVTDRPGHDERYAIDPTKVMRETGWAPRRTFDDGLRATVEWYLEHTRWCDGVRARGYRGERLGLEGVR